MYFFSFSAVNCGGILLSIIKLFPITSSMDFTAEVMILFFLGKRSDTAYVIQLESKAIILFFHRYSIRHRIT